MSNSSSTTATTTSATQVSQETQSSHTPKTSKSKSRRKFPLVIAISLIATAIAGSLIVVALVWQSNALISQNQDTRSDAASGSNQAGCNVVVGGGSGEFPTLQDGIDSLGNSVAGKTICVRNNKVYGQTTINNKSATAAAPLTIKAHPSNTGSNPKAQFRDLASFGDANAYKGTIHITNSKHLVLEGLEIALAPSWGFNIAGSDNLLLKNVVVHDNGRGTIRMIGSTNITVDGCQVYNYGTVQISNGPESINAIESENILVQNCKFWDEINKNGGAGVLSTLRSKNITYRNNEVHSPFVGPILHNDQTENVLYENNIVVGYCNKSSGGTGFSTLDEPYGQVGGPWRTAHTKNLTVRNNLIIGSTSGVSLAGCQRKPGEGPGDPNWIEGDCVAKDITVENNTVIGVGGVSFRYGQNYDKPPQGLSIKNNIFHSVGNAVSQGSNPGNQHFSGNIWAKTPHFGKPPNDTVVANIASVFSSGVNPNDCISSLDLNKYKVADAYTGKGADVNKVGAKMLGSLPVPSPTSTLIPTSTPVPTPTPTPSSTPISTPTPTPTTSPPPASSTNIIKNGNFNTLSFWHPGLGGRIRLDNGSGKYTVTNTNQYNQLLQRNLPLQAGKTYRVRFRARASTASTISIGVIKDTVPYTNYLVRGTTKNLRLTTAWRNFDLTFVAGRFNGTVNDARFRFVMNGAAKNTDFWFDNLVIEKL